MDSSVLTALVLIPFGCCIALTIVPSTLKREIRAISALIALIILFLTIYVFIQYDNQAAGYQFTRQFEWLKSLGVTFDLGVDGISVPMVLLTGIVTFTGVLISWNIEEKSKDFFILLFLLIAGVFGVFVSLDLFFFFFFYELAVLPMYLLIGVWGSSSDFGSFLRPKEYGAMKLMLYLVAGSILVWIGLLATYVESGLGTFSMVELAKVEFSSEFQVIFFPLFMIGFGVLAGLWPFHTWSPDGHVAAPTSVSMLHAGALMKLGAYGILRIGVDLLPYGAEYWMPALMVLGTVNVLYGAVSAMGQQDLKYVIGYSSVSHMGYVLMGFTTLNAIGTGGAVLQMFSHGIMTALFFALVGSIYDQTHVRDIRVLEGIAKRMNITGAFFAIAGLTSLGLPGLSGFVAEVMIFIGAFQDYALFAILGIIGAGITAVYILRLISKVFFGPIGEEWPSLRDIHRVEIFSTSILVALLIVVGLYPSPWMDMINSSVMPLIQKVVGL